MDASSQCLSTLNCEVSIIRAKNITSRSSGDLFVRCYLSAGNNTRVQLNSKEISSKSDLFWNEFFSLECLGTEDAINSLKQENVVFELRWRSTKSSVLGCRIGGSKPLGRAEIPWKNVFESPNMEIETCVRMISSSSCVNLDVKPPLVQVRMKVGAPEITKKRTQNNMLRRKGRWDESCGCKDGGCQSVDYVDYDIFALGFALEA
ncbi:hypothetical protein ACH5RR_012401 [Cinchona calisaya]|uniref:C2 domain-containing protein n=1 Tax=Cinchona calisaya TaxID=153742 RepID=A0ABD3AB96_9GENT